jgi:asparagine synthase (glutamine-hydrolysing)
MIAAHVWTSTSPAEDDTWRAGLIECAGAAESRVWLGHSGTRLDSSRSSERLQVVAQSRLVSGGQPKAAESVALAYERHGLSLTRHLQGDCAFILHDARLGLLVAASTLTSRLPLTYWSRRGTVAIASRTLPLTRHPDAPRELDDMYLAHWLSGSMAAPPGLTPLRGIRRLQVGEALLVRDGAATTRTIDALSPRSAPARGDEIEATWDAIGGAVDRTIRLSDQPCISLSGGLDSATVMVAALERGHALPAFSIVAPRYGDLDESRAVDALQGAWPEVPLSRVDASDESVYPALSDLELRDDPPLTPLMIFPARVQFWKAIAAAGFRTVIDGEGGDQLFSLLVTPFDAVVRGDWGAWLRHFARQPGRRAMLERALVVPLLPREVRQAWARRQARRDVSVPVFIDPGSPHSHELAEARTQRVESTLHRPAADLFERWLSLPAPVGAYASHDHVAAGFGLNIASPLLDREVVELVLGLPPSALLPCGEDRRFQRALLRGKIPESVRTLAKDIRLGEELLPSIVSSRLARQFLGSPAVRERLSEWVLFEKVDAILDAIPRGYRPSPTLAWQLECLTTFAEWYARASAEYGIA